MPSIIDSFKNMSDMQTQGLEPIRNLSVFAVDAFEKMARQNYAFYGDVLSSPRLHRVKNLSSY